MTTKSEPGGKISAQLRAAAADAQHVADASLAQTYLDRLKEALQERGA